QLHAVQGGDRGGGDLRVADAGTGGHEVDLAWDHHRVVVTGIVVGDLALEEPGDGLQPGVRMGRYIHAAGDRDIIRAVVVHEAEGPDEAALTLGEGAVDGHGTWSTERYLTGGDDLDVGTALALRIHWRAGLITG